MDIIILTYFEIGALLFALGLLLFALRVKRRLDEYDYYVINRYYRR